MLSHFSIDLLLLGVRRFGIFMLGLCAFSNVHAQTATAPTAPQDPETIDQIWQKASSKYDSQRATLLKDVDNGDHQGPFRPDWESLQKYEEDYAMQDRSGVLDVERGQLGDLRRFPGKPIPR